MNPATSMSRRAAGGLDTPNGESEVRGLRSLLVRQYARERLTNIQYSRIARLYGFNGTPARTVRQVAGEDRVYPNAVQESHAQALRNLRRDARLLLLWLTLYMR